MNPQHVTSLELSQKLKELGVPQKSEFYHFKGKILMDWEMRGMTMIEESVPISAYLSSELGEMLPVRTHIYRAEGSFVCQFWTGEADPMRKGSVTKHHTISDNSETNARAKMLIYLLENNLITLEKGGSNCLQKPHNIHRNRLKTLAFYY